MPKILQILIALLIVTGQLMAQERASLDWLINTNNLNGRDAIGQHPRGLIHAEEVPALRKKVLTEPFKSMLDELQQQTQSLDSSVAVAQTFQASEVANLAAHQSYLYLLTGKENWALQSYKNLEAVFKDTIIFDNPVSRGLTRAAMLQKIAFAYDFCYPAWTQEQRNNVNRQLYKIIFTTQANMGYDANYSLVSNWMGVRWGSSLFAALVWDNPLPATRSIISPLIWDATKRLSDHLSEVIFDNGWNAESMGYHAYDWSFIGPALIAFQNSQKKAAPSALQLFAPKAMNTMWGILTSTISIPAKDGDKGMKADLSDDNMQFGRGLIGLSFRINPPVQLPTLKWMHDYLQETGLYTIFYYPGDTTPVNPQQVGWLNYVDQKQGVVVFRNRFKDEYDIVATYNASATRMAGHKGPDVNTFRIYGLGSPLVNGAGRTNLTAGQTNLFPESVELTDKGNNNAGALLHYQIYADGSGYACGKGSSTGVQNHKRCFWVDYSGKSGAAAVFVVSDTSTNGKIWRLNTPEFNIISKNEEGFTITTPDGATLRGHVLNVAGPLKIKTGKVKYGGETVANNIGITYRGKNYRYNNWVDVENTGSVTVVLTLQPKGKRHPQVQKGRLPGIIKLGNHEMILTQ